MGNIVPAGFRSQLFLTITSILAAVIIASTTITFLVTRAQSFQAVGDLARAQVGQYTRRAVFAAIVGPEDASTVARLFNEMTEQQALVAVELRVSSGRSLGVGGSERSALSACGFDRTTQIAARLEVVRRGGYWCAVAPIRQSTKDNRPGARPVDSVLGELRIADSLAETQRTVRQLAVWTFGAGLCVLMLGILVAWRSARRLTDPLDQLAEVMRNINKGTAGVRAPLQGPREVVTIATVFNELLGGKEQEALTLENQVDARTRELRTAWEAARAAERYRDVLTSAALTHEMRTPLHVIVAHALDVLGELEFLAGAASSRDHMEVIVKAANELLWRLNQFLELARAEATTGDLELRPVDLGSFAADVRERSVPLAKEHGNSLELECDSLTVVGDRDKLWVILSNLITNACKFTRNGTVRVAIRVRDRSLQFSVSDTGRGITQDLQKRVWREFTRGESVESPAAGFGLGLAIVARLTELLRGTVTLTSEPGLGTSVCVSVPVDVQMSAREKMDVVAPDPEGRSR
jgi:signal transduction histidine kinase